MLRSLCLVLLLCAATSPAPAQLPSPRATVLKGATAQWSRVNSDLTLELTHHDLGTLAQQELKRPAPATADAWLKRLAVFVRADYPEATRKMLSARPKFLPATADYDLNSLVNEAGRYANEELAKRLCELFPEQTTPSGWFETWAAKTPSQSVDRWLEQRGAAGENRWLYARLRFRAKLGTEQALLAPLAARIKAHPEQLEPVEDYLRALRATEKPQDTDWIAGVVRPRLAAEAFVLGGYLQHDAAITLLERALKMPFSPQDAAWHAQYLRRKRFAYSSPNFGLTEELLHTWIKGSLLRLYQENRYTAKAQKLLEEMAAQQPGGILPQGLAYTAGEIQGAGGARVIERRIQKAEPEQKDSAEYWLSRGMYYSGRKEEAQAVEAFEKALSLAPIPADGRLGTRWQIILAYARHLWLRDPQHPIDVFAFLRKEFHLAPLTGDIANGLIEELIHYDEIPATKLLLPDDARLWEYMAAQPGWQIHVRRLLQHLMDNAPAQKEATWNRAEAMANAAPSADRSGALGTLATSQNDYKRAAFWYETEIGQLAALDTETSRQELRTERFNLWEVYRHHHDWQRMERFLPQLKEGVAPEFAATDLMYALTCAAAEAGEKEKAMQYFRQWANQDRRPLPSQLQALSSHGLLPEVRAFYQQIARQEPQSEAPARAFKQIGAP